MIPAGLAFALAYVPAKLAAIDATRALLERLSKEVEVSNDPELKRAIEIAQNATQIDRGIAAARFGEKLTTAAATGVNLPAVPESADKWTAWRKALEVAIATNVDANGRLGLVLGQRAFDLMFGWSRAERIAYLRATRADHPLLVDEATHRVPEVATAWVELERAIASSGRPLLEIRRDSVASWLTHAPAANAVTSTSYSGGASAAMVDWIRTLDMLAENFAKDLDAPVDAPPSRPPTDEEERLVAEIIANPDDDALRHRFAELAAERGDPRAELVREQFAAIAAPGSRAMYSAGQRVRSHPEWTAPLIALGAREVNFTRGFPSEITIDIENLLANAAQLFSLAPITVLRVRGGLAGRGAELAALPQLALLIELDLTQNKMTDADLEALVRSARLARLHVLDLHKNAITAVGVEALAAATHAMPALRSVDLQRNMTRDPIDRHEFYDETSQQWVPTAEGKALEAKYGPLRWLHPGD